MQNLSPAYFGMAMATGIVGIDAYVLGLTTLGQALLALNVVLYALLWTLNLVRLVRYRRAFFDDMFDHLRGPGFFTSVAATGVLGSQLVVLTQSHRAAAALWVIAAVLWLVLTYAIFAALTVKEDKPSLDRGLNGGWLLAVVGTQSIAVLSALVAPHLAQPHRLALNFIALSMWLWGGMLYIWMMSLIFYRYTFFRFAPGDLAPPYWINMGAMAISTLAGSLLILNAADAPLLVSLLPFLKGFTILYWATGTWWIPMLLVLAAWRYGYKRFPLKYDPLYWGAVFPLGMYAAGTFYMNDALDLKFLAAVPPIFFYVAMAAWTAAFIGAVFDVARRLRPAARVN
ncbi:MAG TPA: tellurite resistance/C4-dicarboxylate transporter family protein [Burkholderiales bacterium]|nr:tellurite resistance/C4-dicarboxylate transporter family protein [Burkholderiales bacterium]